jgi:hypothetical protein
MDLFNTEPVAALLDHTLAAPAHGLASVLSRLPWLDLFPPRRIEWNRLDLPLDRLPGGLAGLRVLHLSDFHFRRRWPRAMDLVLGRMKEDPPDLVLITGDFVENKRNYRPAMPQVRRLVEGLTARFGCFAIHGNHDSYRVGMELADTPVTFLDGWRHVLEMPGGNVELIGLPGKRRAHLSPQWLRSLPPPQVGIPRIVLSHFPDHLTRTANLHADLFLAGHTHGGQICLPPGHALMWHDGLPRKLCKGAHRVGKTWLVVSRGLGWTGLPVRAWCAAEVVEIRLQRRR